MPLMPRKVVFSLMFETTNAEDEEFLLGENNHGTEFFNHWKNRFRQESRSKTVGILFFIMCE